MKFPKFWDVFWLLVMLSIAVLGALGLWHLYVRMSASVG
jgi:hypothetical protein